MKTPSASKFWVLIFFLLAIFGTSACKSGKGLAGGKNKKNAAALVACEDNNLKFNTLSLSGKGRADLPSQNINMGMSYRINILADSLIMIRVTKMGLEGVRALITQDSIFVLNRLDRTVHISGYSAAKKFTGLDADFEMVQALILGNFYQVPDELLPEKTEDGPQLYTGEKAGTDFIYGIDSDNQKLSILEAENSELDQHTRISYSAFSEEDKQWMPTSAEMKLFAPQEATITFRHSKIEFNDDRVSFKFKIPNGYERILE